MLHKERGKGEFYLSTSSSHKVGVVPGTNEAAVAAPKEFLPNRIQKPDAKGWSDSSYLYLDKVLF